MDEIIKLCPKTFMTKIAKFEPGGRVLLVLGVQLRALEDRLHVSGTRLDAFDGAQTKARFFSHR
jgi:hypothetical protein